LGKEKRDYSTRATSLKNRDPGRAYVIDVYERKLHPKDPTEGTIDHAKRQQYDGSPVEAQMPQQFFTDYLMEGLPARGYPAHSRVRKVKQRTRKTLRIEALQPEIENGKIRFNQKHVDLINQFAMYPMAKHDDMIDALEMAYRAAQVGASGIVRTVRVAR